MINIFFRFLNIFAGISMILYIFYIRVIIVRAPRDLYFSNPFNNLLLIVAIFWILTSIFVIFGNILILCNVKTRPGFFQKVMARFQEMVVNALRAVFQFITDYRMNSDEVILFLAKRFYNYFGTINELLFPFINYACRLIVLTAFVFDVFYFFKLNYFYKSLILLCVPICISVFFYILKDFASNLDEAKSLLLIEQNGINESTGEPIFSFKLTDVSIQEDLSLEYHTDYFITCSKISGYLKVYDFLSFYYNIRINIFIYSLYLAGWSYILLVNFLY